MDDTQTRLLAGVASETNRLALRKLFNPLAHIASTQMLTSAGLVINAGGSPLVKTGANPFYAVSRGVLVSKAAGTAMAALVGTVANATFNVFCFFVDGAGNLTTQMGVAGASLATLKFPPIGAGQVQIGFVIINPTGTGPFVGGTTALDDATVVPNTAYISILGAFDSTILV